MMNLSMIRVASRLENQFDKIIDLSDIKTPSENGLPSEFYTRSIAALSVIMRCGVESEIAAKSVTDGYHDMGIDAVYDDNIQKKLIVVQSKWRGDGNGGISQDEANAFTEGIRRILNFDFDGCNKKIKSKEQDIISALKDMDYQIEMIYCHTGNQDIGDYALRPILDLLKKVNEDEFTEMLVFKEIKLNDIYEYLAKGQNYDYISINDVLLSNWGVIDEPYKAYYGVIPASALGEWYKEYGNRLFAKNIRYYKGSTEVNQGIKTTLRTSPDMFFYYNNGIKILCHKIVRKAPYSTDRITGLFSLEGVSLVNGAQTTGAIGTAFDEMPEFVSQAKVLVQLIDLGETEEAQATQITRLSNTQNRIDGKDFAALDPEQDRIKTELSFEGIRYLYKSGAVVEDPVQQVSFDEAIIAQACFQDELSIVALVKRNIGALTEDINKAPYKILFNGSTNSFSLYNSVQVLRAVEQFISQNEISATGRKRLVLVHGNRFILHLAICYIKQHAEYSQRVLEKEYIYSNINSLCVDYWEHAFNAMEAFYPDAYPAHVFKNIGRLKDIQSSISGLQQKNTITADNQ
jgi:hypothetical protein